MDKLISCFFENECDLSIGGKVDGWVTERQLLSHGLRASAAVNPFA
jgi:hypothetical protein